MFHYHLNYTTAYKFLIVLLAVLLPFTEYFSAQFTSMAIIMLLAAWLFLNNFKGVLEKIKAEKIIFLFLLFYLINSQGLFREGGSGYTEKVLLKKISLFILPLIIGTSPHLNFAFVTKVLLAFILSLLVSSFFTYTNGIDLFVTTSQELENLSNNLLIHRPYFGLFCVFSIIGLIFFFALIDSKILKVISIILIIYLLFFTAFIQAKMSLLALLLTTIALLHIWLLFKKKYLALTILIFSILVSMGGAYQLSPTVKTYANNIIAKKDFSYSEYNILLVGSINVRYVNWGCVISTLNDGENWLFGVGAGNAQLKLQECYKKTNEWVYGIKMNSHNQFFEETLYNGLIGLSFFLGVILISGIISYKRGNFFHLAFLILFCFCCLTESLLSRQIGIIFFSFFNALLFFNFKNSKIELAYEQENGCGETLVFERQK